MTAVTTTPETPTLPKEDQDTKTKQMPMYNVVLLDDNDHTYEYVIHMLQTVFGYPREKGYLLALEVDTQGRVIVLTTYKELAELKRDQIHAFGRDHRLERCEGSMSAIIEPVPA
jgi:ATP-dependent Clp protease adaptor protein ClpS